MKQSRWMVTVGHVGGNAGLVLALWLVATGAVHWGWLLPWPVLHAFNTVMVSAGLHRYFSHGSFKTSPFWHRFMAGWSVLLLYGSPHAWAAAHTTHHVHSDTPRDPHYATWRYLFDKQFRDVPMVKGRLKRLVGDTTLDFVHRHGLTLWLGFVAAALAVSPTAFLFLYVVPLGSAHLVGAVHQVTSHRGGSPRNLAWLEYLLPTGGEWMHKTHHDRPGLGSFRSRWWHLDLGAAFIHLIRKP